jgi:cholesterol transport system auxiliary component
VNRISLIRPIAVTLAAMALSACALLATPEPVQTYRFGEAAPAASAALSVASPTEVTLRRVEFPQAVEGDRLLGVTGTETAYIAGARWVSPAADLYMASIENAFTAKATRVRLIGPRELIRARRSLDIDVRSFEARYEAPGRAPTIVITARARLLALPEPRIRHRRGLRHRDAGPEHPDRGLDRCQRRLTKAVAAALPSGLRLRRGGFAKRSVR